MSKLEEIGIKSYAGNAYTSIFGTLNREYKRPDSQLAKERGHWGLREWVVDDDDKGTEGNEQDIDTEEDLNEILEILGEPE